MTERLITATDRLADYPRLYETDERYGEGVRRISLLGQHVLYEVNDKARRVNILAVKQAQDMDRRHQESERKRAARTVLTGMCYSVGSATRQGAVRRPGLSASRL